MSENDVVERLAEMGATHDPPQVLPPSLELDEKSIRYWTEVSDTILLSSHSVNIQAAFENERLVHLMVWDWTQQKPGDEVMRYEVIKELQVFSNGNQNRIRKKKIVD